MQLLVAVQAVVRRAKRGDSTTRDALTQRGFDGPPISAGQCYPCFVRRHVLNRPHFHPADNERLRSAASSFNASILSTVTARRSSGDRVKIWMASGR